MDYNQALADAAATILYYRMKERFEKRGEVLVNITPGKPRKATRARIYFSLCIEYRKVRGKELIGVLMHHWFDAYFTRTLPSVLVIETPMDIFKGRGDCDTVDGVSFHHLCDMLHSFCDDAKDCEMSRFDISKQTT